MMRKLLLIMLAVVTTGSTVPSNDVRAATTAAPQSLSGSGRIDAIDPRGGNIVIDDGMLLLSPATRVVDAAGRASSVQALRPGTTVKYSATRDNRNAKPRITEIAILPAGQKPGKEDD